MAIEKRYMVKMCKILNYISSLLMLISVVLRCIDFKSSTDPFFFLLTFYLFGFAVLVIIAEIKIKRVIAYVEILNNRIGKGVYIIFVGLLLFDEKRKSDMLISIFIVLIGLFNVMVSCMRDNKKNYYHRGNTEEIDSDEE